MNFEKPPELADYFAVAEIPVQWGDMDSFQHVNNTIYLRWFESARVEYLSAAKLDGVMAATGTGPILYSVTCNFRRQVRFPDTMLIGAKATRLGGTSIRIGHAIYSVEQKQIVADGESGVVYFDYKKQQAMRIPDEIRALMQTFEGHEI
ncbi:acyl-CoA thioesterase [Blastopirellula marina]|uniref:Predicted thioesterase n=1 Tax=Blastopirellula marina DSM 3645 TaxID=314230 RepID=A3ZM93_9BACT|nr:thioesterase family protein [Blastopirellula marina]EAQ82062.1 Predicted thioesterase [Blastopirellula marina DSM 3645]